MAKLEAKTKLELSVSFTVNESELRALDALAGYGDDAFIQMFYKNLGETYMKPHEVGMREFLKSIRSMASPVLSQTDKARKAFNVL
jgi:hypothetical protein